MTIHCADRLWSEDKIRKPESLNLVPDPTDATTTSDGTRPWSKFSIDEKIDPLCRALWAANIVTTGSCEGHMEPITDPTIIAEISRRLSYSEHGLQFSAGPIKRNPFPGVAG